MLIFWGLVYHLPWSHSWNACARFSSDGDGQFQWSSSSWLWWTSYL